MQRISQLDSLRALAIALVLYSHWLPEGFQFGIGWGHIGVTLFFVLSGFLITGIIVSNEREPEFQKGAFLRGFYARRTLRIFPIYYLTLFVATMFALEPFPESWGWHSLYLSNIHIFDRQQFEGPSSHLWSLSIEEQFYILWPWLALTIPTRHRIALTFYTMILANLAHMALIILLPEMRLFSILPLIAFDGLAAGSLLLLLSDDPVRRDRYVTACATVGIIAFAAGVAAIALSAAQPFVGLFIHIGGMLVSVWLVAGAAKGFGGVGGKVLDLGVLRSLGVVSYGLYLYHNFAPSITLALIELGALPPSARFGISGLALLSSITLILAYGSWFLIERPINGLKSHFPYLRRTATDAIPSLR